jgi:hypothetical protein
MAAQFVRYTPDAEADDPRFGENLQTVLQEVEQFVTGSVTGERAGRAVRSAHAKGYALVKGEVEIVDGLPAPYAQGIYATPGRHGALIRFSNGSGHLGTDVQLGGVVGLSLKIFDIDGPTLLEDEPDARTFDYACINAPIFFCNTVEHYTFIQDLVAKTPSYVAKGKEGFHQLLHDYVTGKGTLEPKDWAWEELRAIITVFQRPWVNLLLSSYWTMGSVRHGEYMAKVRMAPSPDFAAQVVRRSVDPASAAEVFRPALVAELQERPYEFDIQVQLCTDLEKMPVEDLTVEWPEELSAPVTVAKLRVPQQDASGEDNLRKLDALSFNPWRVTAEHRPLGNLMRVRKEAYRHSSILRHRLNKQERREPRSADEVL